MTSQAGGRTAGEAGPVTLEVGVISDTHNFLDPRIPALLEGVEYILHAGDVGSPRLLRELERIAPVAAVGGNTDDPGYGYDLTVCAVLGRKKFLLRHIVNPYAPAETLQADLAREKPDVLVFGHTHKPFCEAIGGVLFFNPGYAGKSRFGMRRSLAILRCVGDEIRPEYLPLDD